MDHNKLQALIFDVDGTLADTERDGHRVAFNKTFTEFGLPWVWDEALYGELLSVTGGKERMKHYASSYLNNKGLPDDFDELVTQIHQSKTKYYLSLLQTGAIPLRSGVERLLYEAHDAGLRLAIATTTSPENVTVLLEHTLGLQSLEIFEVIAAGDVVSNKKPASDIYDYALDKLNLKPEQCMAFEDSHNGIVSAKSAGLATVITINHYTKDHDFTDAVIVTTDFGEPDNPFTVLSGNAYDKTLIDCELIQSLHRKLYA